MSTGGSSDGRPKRKRLAKACDACHKSKRRCDGVSPCSNCFFASKACTYTDNNGRPVPAPRSIAEQPTHPQHQQQQPYYPSAPKRPRPESTENNASPHVTEQRKRPPMELNPAMTRELTNLFFTHCHPAIAAIHKPSFTNALALNQVPPYLLFSICALAARYSKQPSLRVMPGRHSGRQFADEAERLMFEDQDAAQALLILTIYEILAADVQPERGKSASLEPARDQVKWDRGERYRDLTLHVLQTLGIHKADHPQLTPVPSQTHIAESIERECVRRIFWIIYIIDIMRGIYYRWDSIRLGGSGRGYGSGPSSFNFPGPASTPRQPAPSIPPIKAQNCSTVLNLHSGIMGYREHELRLRLPADETSFELGAIHESLPEYLYLPPPREPYASELGHVLRVMTIHQRIEAALAELVALTPQSSPDQNVQIDPLLTMQNTPGFALSSHSALRPTASTGRSSLLTPSESSQTPAPNTPSTSISEISYGQTDVLPPLAFQLNSKKRTDTLQALGECTKILDEWSSYLPPQLHFTETNLNVHRSMFETASNTSAWCFACIHALWASSALALAVAFRGVQVDLKEAWGIDGGRTHPIFDNDVTHGDLPSSRTGDDLGWAVDRLHVVLDLVGPRRRSSMMLGVVIWPMIKYLNRDDQQLAQWVEEYADFTGAKMTEVTGLRWGMVPPRSSELAEAANEKLPTSDTSGVTANSMGSIPPYQAQNISPEPTNVGYKSFAPGINHIIGSSFGTGGIHRSFSNMELSNGIHHYGLDRGSMEVGPASTLKHNSDNGSSATLERHTQPQPSQTSSTQLQTSLPSLKSSGLLEWQGHHPSGQPALTVQTAMAPVPGSGVTGSNIPLQNSHTPPIQPPSPVDVSQNRLGMSWLLNDG
ncbi:hypothetical protein VNI00_000851 [Paramarasmius palmivorus]|uniref:Zn(2)-C6 fungal-type domain-containing protein n=1 Tax=Paramarasmius palmivorus TaxID=297713 RepID=A0AAW0E9Y2_9AGAR